MVRGLKTKVTSTYSTYYIVLASPPPPYGTQAPGRVPDARPNQ